MHLGLLKETLDETCVGEGRELSRDAVRALAKRLAELSSSSEFILDCTDLSLRAVEHGHNDKPLFEIPARGIQARLFLWPPLTGARPHEHSSWTISCVLFNRLLIRSFDTIVAETEYRLHETRRVYTVAGDAGYIYDYGIHSPLNISRRWTATLHLMTVDDVPVLATRTPGVAGLSPVPKLIPLSVRGHRMLSSRTAHGGRHWFAQLYALATGSADAKPIASIQTQLKLAGLIDLAFAFTSGPSTTDHRTRIIDLAKRIYKVSDLQNRFCTASRMKRLA